ncbi:MAG: hypothetical protein ACREDR_19150 [Blastocatellia bacterium]
MKDTKLESVSDGLFDILEPNDPLTATGGGSYTTTTKISEVAHHPDFLYDEFPD